MLTIKFLIFILVVCALQATIHLEVSKEDFNKKALAKLKIYFNDA